MIPFFSIPIPQHNCSITEQTDEQKMDRLYEMQEKEKEKDKKIVWSVITVASEIDSLLK